MKLQIEDINSAGISAEGRERGIAEVEYIGTNGLEGDAKITAYWFGDVRVIDTNGDPVWEDQDGFAELFSKIV